MRPDSSHWSTVTNSVCSFSFDQLGTGAYLVMRHRSNVQKHPMYGHDQLEMQSLSTE